jgi:hypothetical protein
MSFFDDASLVFLPSGEAGKDGKAYSMKPTNGDGDFTFSRGSNLTATRVDSNGLIEKGRENLVTQSNDLSDFTPQGLTTTPNQADPFGGNNATLFTENLSGGNHRFYLLNIPSSSAVHTYSMYVKYNGRSRFKLVINGGNPNATFNTQTGAHITDSGNIIDYKTESIGNDWHRVSFASVCSGWVGGYFVNDSGQDSYTGDGTSGVVLFGAQVELGLVATEYILSGASSGKGGILEDSPRFDYSGGASCPSLLLEPQRTNLIEYSEYFEGSGWTAQAGITLTPNTTETLSPQGLNNAYKVVSTDATKGFYFSGLSITNAAVRTIYLKGSVGGETIVFKDPSGFGTPSTKTLTTDWQRFEMATTNDGNTYQGLFIDDISVGTIYAFGAQLEEGSYPTSYIPNHSGGSVTRDADVNTLLNQSGVIGQTAGTILFDAYFDEAEKVNFSISDSSVSNFISIETTSSNEVTAKVEQGGSTQATITTTTSFFAEGDRLKCAIAYDDRDMAFYINGTQVNTAAPNLIPACDDVRFGNYDGSIKADQRVNRVVLFTTRISDNNLATLTS